jgi:protein SCO1/2
MNLKLSLRTFAVLTILAAMVALTSCSVFGPSFKAEVVKPLGAAPDIQMVDQNGNPFQLSALRGQVVLMFFGFTNCVDECPLTMAHLKLAREMLGDKAQDVKVVLVSTDPVRDTPMALQDFLTKFDPSYLGITGAPEKMSEIWNDYGVIVLDGGETHSSYTYVIDRSGNLRLRIEAETDPKDIASDVSILLAEE